MKLTTLLADRYQIHQQLSQKAGRSTFLAQDLQSQDLVIIKVLRFDADFQWDDLKLFEREASTLQNLNHPAIPKYLDYFEVDDADLRGFALVQTYIEAPSLETVIKEGRKFSEAEVMELADRLLTILIYLHEQLPPVIHRDIKPSNILLTNRSGNSIGDIYLVDFGSVQTSVNKDGGTITIVGSYGYMPLEQFGGKTTAASDLYSLGMTIIYLMTGIHPADLPQINGQIQFTAEISNKLKRWLEKMTHHHLDKRFDSAISAQLSLNSENCSYGSFAHLQPLRRQANLYRDHNKIEIVYRSMELYEESIKRPMFIVFVMIFMAMYFIGWWWASFFLFWLLARIIRAIDQFVYGDSYRKIAIDENNITRMICTGKHKEVKRKTLRISRSRIDSMIYHPGYVFDKYLDENGNEIKVSSGTVKVEPKLRIYCGYDEFLVGNDLMTPAELMWLGRELSDFLNLELQIVYPTPKIPPVSSCGGGC